MLPGADVGKEGLNDGNLQILHDYLATTVVLYCTCAYYINAIKPPVDEL
jgi:hypothetical protein